MIPNDFIYCRPNTPEEAIEAYITLQNEGKSPVYYAGGSEIITMSRAGSIQPGAVIDIKSIPECTQLSTDKEGLNIGAACTLNQIKEARLFHLLALACGRIADHTNQCRITIGGNLCGTIIYRETSLPLLLADAIITILGIQGKRTVPLSAVFDQRIKLSPDELMMQIHVPSWALQAPHFHVKKTTNEKIDYPLVSMAALIKENQLRVAFSGLCSFPFRSRSMEDILNSRLLPVSKRVEKAVMMLPETAHSDVEGTGEYRLFVLKNMLKALLEGIADG